MLSALIGRDQSNRLKNEEFKKNVKYNETKCCKLKGNGALNYTVPMMSLERNLEMKADYIAV